MSYPRRGRARFVPNTRPRFVAGGGKTLILQLAEETDSAQSVNPQRPVAVGQTTSTETAQTITPAKGVTINQLEETDETFGFTFGILAVHQLEETDLAQTIRAGHILSLGQVSETDTTASVRPSHLRSLSLPTSTDTAQTVRPAKRRTLGALTSANTAQAIKLGTVRVNMVFETDTTTSVAVILPVAKRVSVGQATQEDESTFSICPSGGRNFRPVTLTLFHE